MALMSILNRRSTSGSKAAALVAAGVGLATFLNAEPLLQLIQPVLDVFHIGAGEGITNQTAAGATGWLGSWIVLHQRWKRKRKRFVPYYL